MIGCSRIHGVLVLGILLGSLLAPTNARGEEDGVDSIMYRMPYFPPAMIVKTLDEATKKLWLQALARPEQEMRCQGASAFALAKQRGYKGLEIAGPPLRALIENKEQPPEVVLAACRALSILETRDAAGSMLELARSGSVDLCSVIEPSLAAWEYRPAGALWLDRLRDERTSARRLTLAMRGLGALREEGAVARLRELCSSSRTPAVARLEAALALGAIRTEGLEKDAATLAGVAGPAGIVSRSAAVRLLKRHRGEQAIQLLQQLAKDPEPGVASLAVARLLELDSKLATGLIDRLVASGDAKLREQGVEILFREPTEPRLTQLAKRLEDLHPEVRNRARRSLLELAVKKGMRTGVIREGARILAGQSWQGQEQSIVLLALLDHKPAATRFLELLRSPRGEVLLSAGWGLRKLAVPETLPAIVTHVREEFARYKVGKSLPGRENVLYPMVDIQLSHLLQFVGQQKYAPADALLRQFIPIDAGAGLGETRAAAVWSLGLMYEGKTDRKLISGFMGSIRAIGAMPPEDVRVGRMAAVGLGRMKVKEAVDLLKGRSPLGRPVGDQLIDACGWGVAKITGAEWPPLQPQKREELDWFLMTTD